MNNLRRFLYSFVLVAITAWSSSYFTRFGVETWYQVLQKPNLTPPDSWFRIVWTILYILMIISFYMVLRKAKRADYQEANRLFLSQLFLQIMWCFAFFYIGYLSIALVIMLLLLWVVWRMLKNFHKTNAAAALLNIPLFLWLFYACWLNISFVYLNGITVQI